MYLRVIFLARAGSRPSSFPTPGSTASRGPFAHTLNSVRSLMDI